MVLNAVKLASGHRMPLMGFGLWKVPADKAADVVYNAIKLGYRLFDGAYDYQNKREAGQGIRRAIEEGIVKREDVFVTTKLWNTYHRKEHAEPMLKSQIAAWGLGYIDLYMIHFPVATQYISPEELRYPTWWLDKDRKICAPRDTAPIQETWKVLEDAVDAGLVRSIGICNAQAQLLYDIQSYARYPISSLQIEHHPYLVQNELVQLAKTEAIVVTAYSSFGPQSFLELPPAFHARAQGIPALFDVEVIQKAASRLNKTPAQILLRWAVQRGIAVIPKSNNLDRMKQNLEVASEDFDLLQEEVDAISALDRGLRFNDPGYYLDRPLSIFA